MSDQSTRTTAAQKLWPASSPACCRLAATQLANPRKRTNTSMIPFKAFTIPLLLSGPQGEPPTVVRTVSDADHAGGMPHPS